MSIFLSVLGVILLLIATLLALIILALTLPIRLGVEARGDIESPTGTANVRLFGGIIGAGVRVQKSEPESKEPWCAIVGLMVWRRFIPVFTRPITQSPKEREFDTPRTEPTPLAPDDFDFGEPETPEPRVEPITERKIEQPTAPLADDKQRERVVVESPPVTRVHREPEQPVQPEHEVRPVAEAEPYRKPRFQAIRAKIDEFRELYNEWWPVFIGTLRRLRGVFSVTQFHIIGEIGLNDPANTGQIAGYFSTLQGLSTQRGLLTRLGIRKSTFRIAVAPSFDGFVLRGRITTEFRLSPMRIWSAALFAGWRVYRRNHARRREQERESPTFSPATSHM